MFLIFNDYAIIFLSFSFFFFLCKKKKKKKILSVSIIKKKKVFERKSRIKRKVGRNSNIICRGLPTGLKKKYRKRTGTSSCDKFGLLLFPVSYYVTRIWWLNDCQSFMCIHTMVFIIMDWISFYFTSVVQSISCSVCKCSMNESN